MAHNTSTYALKQISFLFIISLKKCNNILPRGIKCCLLVWCKSRQMQMCYSENELGWALCHSTLFLINFRLPDRGLFVMTAARYRMRKNLNMSPRDLRSKIISIGKESFF